MNRVKFEYILELLEDLKDLSLDTPLIVEGKNDEKALREVGVTGEILKVQTHSSVWEFCESISSEHNGAILFTDLDSAGKRIGRNVKKYLTDKGVKVEDNIAKKLLHALDTAQAENLSKRFDKACIKFNYP